MMIDDSALTAAPELQWKLWIYTNYDCNLRCSYCVAKSSPNAPRRAIGLANAHRLVDEAVALGFSEVFFTGGEPFILNEIYAMLAYASARVAKTVEGIKLLHERGFRVRVSTTETPANTPHLEQICTFHRGHRGRRGRPTHRDLSGDLVIALAHPGGSAAPQGVLLFVG